MPRAYAEGTTCARAARVPATRRVRKRAVRDCLTVILCIGTKSIHSWMAAALYTAAPEDMPAGNGWVPDSAGQLLRLDAIADSAVLPLVAGARWDRPLEFAPPARPVKVRLRA